MGLLIFYILVAIFVAWIWVDYFRLIDIFEKNNLLYVALVFFMGAASTAMVYPINWFLIDPFGWHMTGEFVNDFLYATFGIGLVEEVCKMVPFLIFLKFFNSHLREPIDYIAFVAISALGFSAAENVLYFHGYGSDIINSRSILCSVTHMFDTCIVAYGFVLVRFHPKHNNPLIILGMLFLASLAHGFYDFWLLYNGISFGYLITILYFFFTISIFATILNNALNNSSFFTYKKVVDVDLLSKKMFLYYGIVYLAQFVVVSIEKGVGAGFGNLLYSLFLPGIIVCVCVLRLSRFRLIEGRWNPIKLELPFHIFSASKTQEFGFRPFGIRVKGASFNEIYLTKHFQEFVKIVPVSPRNSMLKEVKIAYLKEKVFLKNDEIYFLAHLYSNGIESSYELCLLKPKTSGITRTKKNFPLVGYMEIVKVPNKNSASGYKKKYRFREWVYLTEAGVN